MTFWTISAPDIFNNVVGVDTAVQYALAPHSANIAAAFSSDTDATGAGASLSQMASTLPILTYDVSLWVANPIQDAANFNNVFSISWNGQLISLSNPYLTETASGSKMYVVTPSTPWFQLVVTNLPVTGAMTELKISARNNDWATLVDDVIVEPTPEPSTVVMLCAGAALLGARRRRQQRVS